MLNVARPLFFAGAYWSDTAGDQHRARSHRHLWTDREEVDVLWLATVCVGLNLFTEFRHKDPPPWSEMTFMRWKYKIFMKAKLSSEMPDVQILTSLIPSWEFSSIQTQGQLCSASPSRCRTSLTVLKATVKAVSYGVALNEVKLSKKRKNVLLWTAS